MDEIRLLNYLKGELSEEEILQVEAWYEASPDNKKMLEQLYYTMFIGERAAVMESVDVEKSLNRLKTAIKRKEDATTKIRSAKWKRYVFPLAAFFTGIVLTVGLSYITLNNKVSNYIVATPAGQRAQFVLPDGSKVWLNSSTQLSYRNSFWSKKRQSLLLVKRILRWYTMTIPLLLLAVRIYKHEYWVLNLMCVPGQKKRKWLLLC